MAALLDLFNELEKMRRGASSSLSSIALIVGCYSMIHLSFTQLLHSRRRGRLNFWRKKEPHSLYLAHCCEKDCSTAAPINEVFGIHFKALAETVCKH